MERKMAVLRSLLTVFVAVIVQASPTRAGDDSQWMAVTMARDASWGIAADGSMAAAIAIAVDACKTMSRDQSDCGAEFRTIKRGWILGLLCGDHKVLATGKELEDAEAEARLRIELKRFRYGELPTCRTVLAVHFRGLSPLSDPHLRSVAVDIP